MPSSIAIIGAGPAGLMAAEAACAQGCSVDIYEAMPSVGRKFLMAGKSGLNITHAEDAGDFRARYRCDDHRLDEIVMGFDAVAVITWMEALGVRAHTGPTGRVFPEMMKASPLLRAWLARLTADGVKLHTRHRWTGWGDDGALLFDADGARIERKPDAVIFALGGGSWRRLGSDGEWADLFEVAGVPLAPFAPSNCGFLVDWSPQMLAQHIGAPVKAVRLSAPNGETSRGEFVITARGVESGGIYALSAALRDALVKGEASLTIDLLPDISMAELVDRLGRPRGKQSQSNFLRKVAGVSGVKLALLYEACEGALPGEATALADVVKACPIMLTGSVPIDEAISTAGGVRWDALDDVLMLRERPGTFCAGEMLDWDAPTGGYLITACLATGRVAGLGAAAWVASRR